MSDAVLQTPPPTLSLPELVNEAQRLQSLGRTDAAVALPALLKSPDTHSRGELLARVSAPLLATMLALLAIPLSFVNPRGGRTNNLILAILVYLIYSNAVSVSQAWVGQGRVRFDVGLWIPHLTMLGVLAILFYRRISVFARWRRR